MDRRETMWAEMRPDVYDGPTCDRVKPQWSAHAAGDKGDAADGDKVLKLKASTFPPGTKVTIAEPTCPDCGELREPTMRPGPLYAGPCRCGFDWDRWVQEQYC